MWQRWLTGITVLTASAWLVGAAAAAVVLSGDGVETLSEISGEPKAAFTCVIVAIVVALARKAPAAQ